MVQKLSREELPHVQGQEQWLRFAGAAVKRYPASKVRETQVRWSNLITQTTALSNSMKLSHALWGHPRWAGHGGEV